jgi:predicted DNA binding CopG/RHH family protein
MTDTIKAPPKAYKTDNSTLIQFRLTRVDLARITERASKYNMTINKYLKDVILNSLYWDELP